MNAKTMNRLGICLVVSALFGCGAAADGGGGPWTSGNGGSSGAGSSGSGSGTSSSGGTASGGSGGASSGSSASSGGGASSGKGASSGASSGGSGSGASSSGTSAGDGGATSSSGGVTTSTGPFTDADIAYSVTLTMAPFTVAPGKEVFMCQSFANPFKGQQVDIKTYDLNMAQGSHHMFLFYESSAANSTVAPCPQGGLTFAPFTFSAQSQKATQTYPQGVGATIPTSIGFSLNVHYINAGSTPIAGSVQVTMSVAKPGIIMQHAGVIFLNQISLSVAASGQAVTSSRTYKLPQDVYILSSGSHMHQRATNFVSTTSTGVTLFQTTQWAEPPSQVYSPPLHLTSGTSITWSCTYVNSTGATLVFGESASTNVMCIGVTMFYPVSNVANPVISSMQ